VPGNRQRRGSAAPRRRPAPAARPAGDAAAARGPREADQPGRAERGQPGRVGEVFCEHPTSLGPQHIRQHQGQAREGPIQLPQQLVLRRRASRDPAGPVRGSGRQFTQHLLRSQTGWPRPGQQQLGDRLQVDRVGLDPTPAHPPAARSCAPGSAPTPANRPANWSPRSAADGSDRPPPPRPAPDYPHPAGTARTCPTSWSSPGRSSPPRPAPAVADGQPYRPRPRTTSCPRRPPPPPRTAQPTAAPHAATRPTSGGARRPGAPTPDPQGRDLTGPFWHHRRCP